MKRRCFPAENISILEEAEWTHRGPLGWQSHLSSLRLMGSELTVTVRAHLSRPQLGGPKGGAM